MNRIERAAAEGSGTLAPLDPRAFTTAPVLTPVLVALAAGAAAGAAVGGVHCYRHGCVMEELGYAGDVTDDISEMSVGDLLRVRQDVMVG